MATLVVSAASRAVNTSLDHGPSPDDAGATDTAAGPRVRVIRSPRRRRTASAREIDGVIEVRVPARLPSGEEARMVERLVARIARRRLSAPVDLVARARLLAERYDLPPPASIRWVDNQRTRWGSCSPATGTIRLSTRLAGYPDWVIDYVIVHELAHLRVAGHGRDFWALVERYPLAERARGFLMAMSHGNASSTP